MDQEGPVIPVFAGGRDRLIAHLSLAEAASVVFSGSESGDGHQLFASPLQWTKRDLDALRCFYHERKIPDVVPEQALTDDRADGQDPISSSSNAAEPSHVEALCERHAEKDLTGSAQTIARSASRPARMYAMHNMLEYHGFLDLCDKINLPTRRGKRPIGLPCETFLSPPVQLDRWPQLVGEVDYFTIIKRREQELSEDVAKQATPEVKETDPYIAGLLIALAQKCQDLGYKSPYRVCLLVRNFRDNSKMRVYTATVTKQFLAKMKRPTVAPKAPLETRLNIVHMALDYKPFWTLHSRLMTAIFLSEFKEEDVTEAT